VAEIVPIATPAVPQNNSRANQLDRGCANSGTAQRAKPDRAGNGGRKGRETGLEDWLNGRFKV